MLVHRKLDDRLQWFPQARFGMFVHFGLYALLERGEWVMYHEDIPREEYEKLARRFNPRGFNAGEWVDVAQRAGARYLTVTAKHHDGFCLFDSALTDYKVTNTPFGRDLIGELIEACHRRRMRIVLYYSQPDWHHPSFVHRPKAFKDLQYERPDDEPDWERYMDYVEGQVLELCTRYGRIDGVWFDGVHKTEQEWRGRRLYALIKKHQPGAVVNERAGCGDFFTPERSLVFPASAAGYTVEACQAICVDAWGHKRDGVLFSSPVLIESLVRTAAAGGNYLLNIGPLPDGSLPEDQVRRLEHIGDWLAVHGRAVYGTQGCPLIGEGDDVLYTRREDRVYAHLLRWPDRDAIVLSQLRRAPRRATLLGAGTRLTVGSTEDGVVLRGLPAAPAHCAVNVVEMVFEDAAGVLRPLPRPDPPRVYEVRPDTFLALPAEGAVREGFGPKGSLLGLQALDQGAACLWPWSSPEQKARWQLRGPGSVRCEVMVELACPAPYEGSTFAVRVAGQTLQGTVPTTGGFRDFTKVRLGAVDLPAGRSTLTLAPTRLNYGYIFAAVKQVVLTPHR